MDIFLKSRVNELRVKNDQLAAAKLNVVELKHKAKELDSKLTTVESQKRSEGKAADSNLKMAVRETSARTVAETVAGVKRLYDHKTEETVAVVKRRYNERIEGVRKELEISEVERRRIDVNPANEIKSRTSIRNSIEHLKAELLRNPDSSLLQQFLFFASTNHFTGKQSNEIVLSWQGAQRGRPRVTRKFYRMSRQAPAVETSKKTRRRWIKAQADIIEAHMRLYSKAQCIDILKCLAKRTGLVVLNLNEISISVYDCIAIRDWVQTSNNGLYRMKQSIEALAPALARVMFPPAFL